MTKNSFFTIPSLIFLALFLLAIASIILYIPSAGGQEILCVPKTSELPKPITSCPGANCDRMDIGVQSFWDFEKEKEIRKVLDDVIKNELPPVLTALKEIRNVVKDLKSNCSYSMDPPNPGIDTPAVACDTDAHHPIYKTDDRMGSDPPTKTIVNLMAKKQALSKTLQNPADSSDGFAPQAVDIFSRLFDTLSKSLNFDDGDSTNPVVSISECANDPLRYLLSCGELSTLENADGSKIVIGGARGRCPQWDFISVFCIAGF